MLIKWQFTTPNFLCGYGSKTQSIYIESTKLFKKIISTKQLNFTVINSYTWDTHKSIVTKRYCKTSFCYLAVKEWKYNSLYMSVNFDQDSKEWLPLYGTPNHQHSKNGLFTNFQCVRGWLTRCWPLAKHVIDLLLCSIKFLYP